MFLILGLDFKDLTPEERAVLQPPYAVRTERPCVTTISANGGKDVELSVESRTAEKKAHDKKVFGTKWF